MNKVILIGYLGKDPETKFVGSSKVCNFSIATNKTWMDKNDVKQERVTWHNIQVWGRLAEICGEYLKKGRQVMIEGEIETRSYQSNKYKDEQGEPATVYATDIRGSHVEFLGGGSGSKDGGSHGEQEEQTAPQGD